MSIILMKMVKEAEKDEQKKPPSSLFGSPRHQNERINRQAGRQTGKHERKRIDINMEEEIFYLFRIFYFNFFFCNFFLLTSSMVFLTFL